MKCAERPYWNTDETREENWANVARPFLDHKLKAIEDVLHGCNVKRYEHYEGALHFTWLKLQLDPFEIRVRLDADAEDNDYIPNVLGLVERVRSLVNQAEFRAFAKQSESMAVYLPSRADVEELRARRSAEAEAYAAWQEAHEATSSGEASNEESAIGNQPRPQLSAGLEITTVEFIKVDGSSLLYDLHAETWRNGN